MRDLLWLMLAGSLGTLSRYAISGWAYRLLGERMAWGTLVVNVAGCLALSFVAQLGLATDVLTPGARNALTVGFLGAFTTFSTFGYETVRYLESGAWGVAACNVIANLILGLAAAWGGLAAGRALFGGS